MALPYQLCSLIGITPATFSKEENYLVEIILFVRICHELRELFRREYKNYFQLMKFSNDMEETMLETNFTSLIVKDILATNEYTLEGIAYYANTPIDVIHELLLGLNTAPSAFLFRKIIELHQSVRTDLYKEIIKKITTEYLSITN